MIPLPQIKVVLIIDSEPSDKIYHASTLMPRLGESIRFGTRDLDIGIVVEIIWHAHLGVNSFIEIFIETPK